MIICLKCKYPNKILKHKIDCEQEKKEKEVKDLYELAEDFEKIYNNNLFKYYISDF